MKRKIGSIIVAAVFTGIAIGVAWADSENPPFNAKPGTLTGCVGVYTGYAKYTNSAGSTFITPSNGISRVTFTDASGLGSNYVSIATVTPFGQPTLCSGTNSITVPVTNSTKYEFIVYVKSTVPPPTNGQPMNLQVNWQP